MSGNFLLVENGELYDPAPKGKNSLLIALGRVIRIGAVDGAALARAGVECEVVDAAGCVVVPGFVDPHAHLIGAGGESGYLTRTPEIQITELVGAGITTVVGCLGTDSVSRSLAALLAKVRALEEEGISAWMYTGAFRVPPPTLTGRIDEDLVLIDKVVGVGEVAIADRRSSQPTPHELARIVSEAGIGGMLSGKAGVTHFHVGPGGKHLSVLHQLLDEYELRPELLYATHVERTPELLEDAVRLARRGAYVDMDAIEPGIGACLRQYLESDGPAERLSVSSDAHATDSAGRLYEEFLACVHESDLSLETVLPHFTRNAAEALKLRRKGRLEEGSDGDLLVLRRDSLEIRHVVARGRVLLREGRLACRGRYEHLATDLLP